LFANLSLQTSNYKEETISENLFLIYKTVLSYISLLIAASTSRRHLIVWKYNPSGCLTALKCKVPLESLCYSK